MGRGKEPSLRALGEESGEDSEQTEADPGSGGGTDRGVVSVLPGYGSGDFGTLAANSGQIGAGDENRFCKAAGGVRCGSRNGSPCARQGEASQSEGGVILTFLPVAPPG